MILQFPNAYLAKQFLSAYFSRPIFIIQILKINFDSLSISGEAVLGLWMVRRPKIQCRLAEAERRFMGSHDLSRLWFQVWLDPEFTSVPLSVRASFPEFPLAGT